MSDKCPTSSCTGVRQKRQVPHDQHSVGRVTNELSSNDRKLVDLDADLVSHLETFGMRFKFLADDFGDKPLSALPFLVFAHRLELYNNAVRHYVSNVIYEELDYFPPEEAQEIKDKIESRVEALVGLQDS